MHESWYSRHIDLISKLKLVLIILCLIALPASLGSSTICEL